MSVIKKSYETGIPGNGHARESVGMCSLWSYKVVMNVQYGALVVHGQLQISGVGDRKTAWVVVLML